MHSDEVNGLRARAIDSGTPNASFVTRGFGGGESRSALASESLTQFREGQWVTVFFGFEPNSRPGRQGRVQNSLRFSRPVTGLKSRREFVIGLPARSGSVPGRTRQVGHARCSAARLFRQAPV